MSLSISGSQFVIPSFLLLVGAGQTRSVGPTGKSISVAESMAGPTLGRESDMDIPRVVHLSLLNLTFLTGYFLLFILPPTRR